MGWSMLWCGFVLRRGFGERGWGGCRVREHGGTGRGVVLGREWRGEHDERAELKAVE